MATCDITAGSGLKDIVWTTFSVGWVRDFELEIGSPAEMIRFHTGIMFSELIKDAADPPPAFFFAVVGVMATKQMDAN